MIASLITALSVRKFSANWRLTNFSFRIPSSHHLQFDLSSSEVIFLSQMVIFLHMWLSNPVSPQDKILPRSLLCVQRKSAESAHGLKFSLEFLRGSELVQSCVFCVEKDRDSRFVKIVIKSSCLRMLESKIVLLGKAICKKSAFKLICTFIIVIIRKKFSFEFKL